jgi:hypothetical protein
MTVCWQLTFFELKRYKRRKTMTATLRKIIIESVVISMCLCSVSHAFREPAKPKTDFILEPHKEYEVNRLVREEVDEVFAELKDNTFQNDPRLLRKAIHEAFKDRPQRAVRYALGRVASRAPSKEAIIWNRGASDEAIGRDILKIFPEEAADMLPDVFYAGTPYSRGNLIRAAGTIAGGENVHDLLIDALYDQEFCEPEMPDTAGLPMRVCDVAYNQLVLRYKIPNVLRTIGVSHSISARNYHIDQIKKIMNQ